MYILNLFDMFKLIFIDFILLFFLNSDSLVDLSLSYN